MVALTPFERSDFDTLAGWFSSAAEAVQWGGAKVRYPLGVDQLDAMLAETVGASPKRLAWMARTAGRAVGHAQLGLDWAAGNARLGRVVVAPSERGRGIARPMLGLVLDAAFANPAIHRVDLRVYTFNQPAIRSYAGLGFVHEGILRSYAPVGDERWDSAIMSVPVRNGPAARAAEPGQRAASAWPSAINDRDCAAPWVNPARLLCLTGRAEPI